MPRAMALKFFHEAVWLNMSMQDKAHTECFLTRAFLSICRKSVTRSIRLTATCGGLSFLSSVRMRNDSDTIARSNGWSFCALAEMISQRKCTSLQAISVGMLPIITRRKIRTCICWCGRTDQEKPILIKREFIISRKRWLGIFFVRKIIVFTKDRPSIVMRSVRASVRECKRSSRRSTTPLSTILRLKKCSQISPRG